MRSGTGDSLREYELLSFDRLSLLSLLVALPSLDHSIILQETSFPEYSTTSRRTPSEETAKLKAAALHARNTTRVIFLALSSHCIYNTTATATTSTNSPWNLHRRNEPGEPIRTALMLLRVHGLSAAKKTNSGKRP